MNTVTDEEYLEHNIRLVYAMDAVEPEHESQDGSSHIDELMAELKRGTIFKFPYSYRGGLEADAAFLLTNEAGEVMLAVGSPTQIEFIGMSAPAATVDESDSHSAESDLMDFDII